MNPSRQGINRIASSLKSHKHTCLSCRLRAISISYSSRRQQHTVPAATVGGPSPSPSPPTPPPLPGSTSVSKTAGPSSPYTIQAGILLSRAPILTPDPHPFETAYQFYQRRLNERLVLPFGQYFYYQRDTPAFERWRTARRARNGVASRDVAGYNAHGRESWNDEVLVGDRSGEKDTIVKQLIQEEGRETEFVGDRLHDGEGGVEMAGLRRRTEADEKGDTKSLERALSRMLYLMVKRKSSDGNEGSYWSLPNGTLRDGEGLREAAERILYSSCGPNMHTWFIGNHPVGHYVYRIKNLARLSQSAAAPTESSQPSPAAQSEALSATAGSPTPIESIGQKTFFMKSRILKGQADPTHHSNDKGSEAAVEDFQWLSKEEIHGLVNEQYWAGVKNMLQE